MLVAIVGGRLQGLEAAYLCSKAHFETLLIDIEPDPPAKGLSDDFHQINIVNEPWKAKRELRPCDAVLPANENRETLIRLRRICHEIKVPFMQDNRAFWITSDKLKSMHLLRESRIPTPAAWPKSGFPVIVKPSNKSGSEGVYRADNKRQLESSLEIVRGFDDKPVVQEFVEGLALSLEVISRDGVGHPLEITGLEFDDKYGCKRVYAPVEIAPIVKETMMRTGAKVASNLRLNGLTDVQALLDGSTPRVNEINARLPSQTPSVVYHSADINMVELLTSLFIENKALSPRIHPEGAVLYQHVQALGKELRVQGEHVLARVRGLRVKKDFFGADEAITNMELGADATNRVATLIVKSHDLRSASKKMRRVVGNIMSEYHLSHYVDPSPNLGRPL